MLPTELPLKEFYAELSRLYRDAIPLTGSVAMLKRLPLKEIPAMLLKSVQLLIWIRNAYRDHDREGALDAAQ